MILIIDDFNGYNKTNNEADEVLYVQLPGKDRAENVLFLIDFFENHTNESVERIICVGNRVKDVIDSVINEFKITYLIK